MLWLHSVMQHNIQEYYLYVHMLAYYQQLLCVCNVLVEISNHYVLGCRYSDHHIYVLRLCTGISPIWGKRICRELPNNALSCQTSEEVRLHKMLLAQNMLVC